MSLLFAAAQALVPCPAASLPDVIVAPALIPCPSASALPCRCRRRRLSSLARQNPHSTAVVVAASSRPLPVSVRPRLTSSLPPTPPTAADAPVRLSSFAAALAVQLPPLPSLQPPSSSAATIIVATKPSSPPPPPPISCFLGEVPFHVQRN